MNHTAQSELSKLVGLIGTSDGNRRYFVDFDHTLYLGNSTESFVGCARPASLYALILKAVGFLKPWCIAGESGYFVYRDTIRLFVLMLLAPWTFLFFNVRARSLWSQQKNKQLDLILSDVPAERIVIVSFGFKFVIRNLLKGTRYENCEIVAPNIIHSPAFRKSGKLAAIEAAGVKIDLEKDVVITDSAKDDADLLAAFSNGVLIDWPNKITIGGLAGAYIPFFYTAKIKRSPGFLIKQIGLEELALVLVAYAVISQGLNLAVLLSLSLMFIAYKIVYEAGYAENDKVGFEKEEAPKLSKNFFKMKNYAVTSAAWVYSAALNIAAVFVLDVASTGEAVSRLGLKDENGETQSKFIIFCLAMAIAAMGRIIFWLFNHAPLKLRVFLYLPLHISKYFGWTLIFPLSALACALLLAQVIRTWAFYAIRRSGGDIHFLPSQLTRLCFFVLFIPIVAIVQEPPANIFTSWELYFILGVCLLRAAPEVLKKMVVTKAETKPQIAK